MRLTRRALIRLAGGAVAAPVLPVRADEWPSRPIRILVGTAPGGSPDIMSRLLGDKIGERIGQSFVVENRRHNLSAVRSGARVIGANDAFDLAQDAPGLLRSARKDRQRADALPVRCE